VDAIAKWAAERNVPLYCGEFGAFKDHSDPKMRAAWINDTRTALESRQIGWAMWDYDGNFGLANKTSAGIVFDPAILQALGMEK
jgi:aryl-phospho-beta-D-glucosidase BglC (GH1 family)